MLRKGLIALFILLIAACGGGGGGGGSSAAQPSSSSGAAATFSPNKITLSFYSGESVQFSVVASASTSITGNAYVQIVDANQVLDASYVNLTKNSTYSYTATLQTNASLAPGHYTGSLSVHICKDAACASEWPGSPAPLPYDFTVQDPATAPRAATATPSTLSATMYEGDTLSAFPVTVNLTSTHYASVYLSPLDTNGIVQPFPNAISLLQGANQIYLSPSASLTAGHYTGTVVLRMCPDYLCASQIIGSPISVNYDFTVHASTNLTALSSWGGVPDWETYQGNVAHTGYVPVTLDTSKFIRRWKWTAPHTLTHAVAANGKVYVSSSGYFDPSTLYALQETDASIAWQYDFPGSTSTDVFALNPPAVSGGKVFVATSGHTDTFMWSFDPSNGTQLFKTPFNSQWAHYESPSVSNGNVYANGGYYGGIYKFDGSTGAVSWSNVNVGWSEEEPPAVDSTYAYISIGSDIKIINLADGSMSATIADSNFSSFNGSPVLTSNNSIITLGNTSAGGALVDFDLGTRLLKWSSACSYGKPAFASGVVYVFASEHLLEARAESDGTLLWSWSPADPANEWIYGGNIIVTDNLILLSTNKNVYAISKTSHQPIWTYSKAGQLALSANGILYISSDTELHAINVK